MRNWLVLAILSSLLFRFILRLHLHLRRVNRLRMLVRGAVLNSSELAATITVPVLFVVIVTMLVAMRQIAKRRRARRLARFEARNEREVQSMEAQKSVKKINAEAMKRELALLQDERAAERALIKTYKQHMKKSKEKVEKAIALRIQLEKERKAAKRAESIQNR